MTKTQELEREVEALKAKVATLEQRPLVVISPAPKTEYEKWIANGGTHRGWIKRERVLAREHW